MATNRYIAEYAVSGRATCKDKDCKELVAKGSLTLVKVSPNAFNGGEGDMRTYYHPKCIFATLSRARPDTKRITSLGDIENSKALKAADRKLIETLIATPVEKQPKAAPKKKKAPAKKSKKDVEEEEDDEADEADDDEDDDEEEEAAPAAKKGGAIFAGVAFCISGTLSMKRADFVKLISDNGGSVAGSVTKAVQYLITTEEEASNPTTKVTAAQNNSIPLVSEDFIVESVKEGKLLDPNDYSVE